MSARRAERPAEVVVANGAPTGTAVVASPEKKGVTADFTAWVMMPGEGGRHSVCSERALRNAAGSGVAWKLAGCNDEQATWR